MALGSPDGGGVSDHLSTLARLEPGDPIPAAAAAWLIVGFKLYMQTRGSIPLGSCLGLHAPDSPKSPMDARDYYLRLAFSAFEPRKDRANSSAVAQFTSEVNAFRNTYRQFKRTGRIPSVQFELYLYLAFASSRVPISESQIRRIVQP